MTEHLGTWQTRPRPGRVTLDGRYVRLEPLRADMHAGLYDVAVADDEARFAWLFESRPSDRAAFGAWLAQAERSDDPLHFAVIDKASGMVAGRQALMRVDPTHGCIEIGSIYWGPPIARTPAATEAQYLFMRYAFAELGYRRYEWKCNDRNEPSKRAALRFGFTYEGLFRQHMVVKGENRDTAWFAIIDKDWPALERGYEAWLDPRNFDAEGRQKHRLADLLA
jgi:RimJ/RimL family protein N-acetyltransferase